MKHLYLLVGLCFLSACVHSPSVDKASSQYELGVQSLRSMTGCFLVDYSYTETESLKKGYSVDKRFYDPNRNKHVKEWIQLDTVSPQRLRLQHVLFFTDLNGDYVRGSELKHQTEDWEYGVRFLYDYTGHSTWNPLELKDQDLWLRRITNLDEGLRYQCASRWSKTGNISEWSCDNYAPIPGRETRDMKRSDYQALQRSTHLVNYGQSWVERQNNTKIIQTDAVRTPLAQEIGKNWYVHLPDSECREIRDYTVQHENFWKLLRETWDLELAHPEQIKEKSLKPPRFVKIDEIEEKYQSQNLNDPEIYKKAQAEVMNVILQYRETQR